MTNSLKPCFSHKISEKIIAKTVSVGKFDGIYPTLTAATAGSKVFLYSSHSLSGIGGRLLAGDVADVSILNINQKVQAVAVGHFGADENRDILVVGTPTHILAYDVYNNSDLFYREVPDGVNCIIIGKFGDFDQSIAVCGGNCAIQGFDSSGLDPFWTVTGDNVTVLCFCDFNGDGKVELIVGSEDFEIRVFKMDEIVTEITETDAISHLCPSGNGNRFAYALKNGTLGLYEGDNRLWRIKSKNQVTSLAVFDIDSNGYNELIVGWSNGKVDFRRFETGEVLFKVQLGSSIAGLVVADYRMDGHEQLICCSVDGEVRGFLSARDGGSMQQTDPTQEILHEFGTRRKNLLVELDNFKECRRRLLMTDNSAMDCHNIETIPINTQIQTSLCVNVNSDDQQPCVDLILSTTNESIIRIVMVFAEGIFAGESYTVHPNLNQVSSTCTVHLRPVRDISVDLHIKALIGHKNSLQFHVFETSRTLPRFAMYALCGANAPAPTSHLKFHIADRSQRLALWINENFLFQDQLSCDRNGKLDVLFFSLRGSGMIFIEMDAAGEVIIRCDDIELVGNLVHAFVDFLGIKDLSSIADFPSEVNRLVFLFDKVNEMYLVRDRLAADVADHSNLIKALVVRAEDARLIDDMKTMKRYCTQLFSLNQTLITQYKVRCNNHEELLGTLKMINQIVQKASRLRGKPKTDLIAACRDAIKNDLTEILPKLIRFGANS